MSTKPDVFHQWKFWWDCDPSGGGRLGGDHSKGRQVLLVLARALDFLLTLLGLVLVLVQVEEVHLAVGRHRGEAGRGPTG